MKIAPYPNTNNHAKAGKEELQGGFESSRPGIVKRLLNARGISSEAQLSTSLRELPNPNLMKGMDTAVSLLAESLTNHQSILLCGDYDADGATSVALMFRVLRDMGAAQIAYLVPNRFDFGYGLSPELVEVAAQQNPKLIITLDNGISSIAGVARARELGINVIVTDHHLPGEELPKADAIVNPNQPGCGFPSKHLAGVGVAFYLLIALRKELRNRNWFAPKAAKDLSDRNPVSQDCTLEQYLDLVALGTVADLVELDHLNRILVSNGLRLIRSGAGNPGIKTLMEVANKPWSQCSTSDLGFAAGPRINAAGRLDEINSGIECLIQNDYSQVYSLAQGLDAINQERKLIQSQMTDDAEKLLADLEIAEDSTLRGYCCFQEHWHQGVVGLVASKIKDKIYRPVIAFANADEDLLGDHGANKSSNENVELKGSARSIKGCHIRDCLEQVNSENPGLIIKFGGHAMAAGLSIKKSNYQQFAEKFNGVASRQIDASDLQNITYVDGSLPIDLMTVEGAKCFEDLLPWGMGVPEPVFCDQFEVIEAHWLKNAHIKMRLARSSLAGSSISSSINSASAQLIDAIWFNLAPDSEPKLGESYEFVYRINVNRFQGREQCQLIVQGIAGNSVSPA